MPPSITGRRIMQKKPPIGEYECVCGRWAKLACLCSRGLNIYCPYCGRATHYVRRADEAEREWDSLMEFYRQQKIVKTTPVSFSTKDVLDIAKSMGVSISESRAKELIETLDYEFIRIGEDMIKRELRD